MTRLEQMPEESLSECDYIEEWLDTNKEIRSTFKTAIEALKIESVNWAIRWNDRLNEVLQIIDKYKYRK